MGGLARRQVAPLALAHTLDGERADPDAPKPLDRNVDRLHHPPHDVLHTDVEHHLDDDAVARFAQEPELVRHDQGVIDEDAPQHALHGAVVRPRWRHHVVFLGQTVARVHDPVRQLAVVSQEEQTLGIAVEPPDWVNALADVDQVHHRPPVTLVAGRGDVARRFVEHDRARPLLSQGAAVNPDLGSCRVHFRAELGDDLAIDRDPALADHRFGGAA